MKVALDAMGGDFAPKATVEGAILSLDSLQPDTNLLLFGPEQIIKPLIPSELLQSGKLILVDCPEVIEMGEHPTKALQAKPNSSIVKGFGALAMGKIDVFASAGNTGAMMVGALFSVKATPGIPRPAIAGFTPRPDGGFGVLLDIGANADCKPEMLLQFAVMGSLYAQHVLKIEKPKVALINIGEEEQKGSMLTQNAYQLLKTCSTIDFIGNIEGRDIFTDKADVMVCDGFTGNVILKMAESFYDSLLENKLMNPYFSQFNYEEVGGSPILGVNGNVIIGHGISSPKAIKNMLMQAESVALSGIHKIIAASLNNNEA
jgi:glycerol-3-phosphate acyltransferase PlsX